MSGDLRAGVERVLRENGLTDEPAKYDSNIHSWRCEYPDAYSPCECFTELLTEILAVTQPLLDERDALAAKVAALTSALERTEANFVAAVNGRPVRDMTENLAENRAALRDQP